MKASAHILSLSLLLTCAIAARAQGTIDDYRRAESFLPWNAEKLMFPGNVEPNFVAQGDTFFYRSSTREGDNFMLVDPAAKSRAPAFDHARLALALSAASGKQYDPLHLLLSALEFIERDQIRFTLEKTAWICDLTSYACAQTKYPGPAAHELASPDGKWIAYLNDYDVFARSTLTTSRRSIVDSVLLSPRSSCSSML